jgi:hypothetical protein
VGSLGCVCDGVQVRIAEAHTLAVNATDSRSEGLRPLGVVSRHGRRAKFMVRWR